MNFVKRKKLIREIYSNIKNIKEIKMNTYLVPTTAPYIYEPYDYILMVYANSPKEAYRETKTILAGYCVPQELSEYEYYPIEIYIPNNKKNIPFHFSKKYDILYNTLRRTKGFEHMAYFKVKTRDKIWSVLI